MRPAAASHLSLIQLRGRGAKRSRSEDSANSLSGNPQEGVSSPSPDGVQAAAGRSLTAESSWPSWPPAVGGTPPASEVCGVLEGGADGSLGWAPHCPAPISAARWTSGHQRGPHVEPSKFFPQMGTGANDRKRPLFPPAGTYGNCRGLRAITKLTLVWSLECFLFPACAPEGFFH